MKKVLLTLVFGLFFTAFSIAQTSTEKSKKEFTVAKEKVAEYQCPMDCEKGKTYDKAGSCPVCKMDLKVKSAKKAKGCCAGKKAKASSCNGKKKSSCGSKKAKASSCNGKKKSSCGSKKAKASSCAGKKKSSCGSKK